MKTRYILVCIFLLLANPCIGHEPPPVVEVDFAIKPSSQFDKNLDDNQKQFLHDEMVAILEDWCKREFGFLLWKAAAYRQDIQSQYRLTYVLSDKPLNNDANNFAGFQLAFKGGKGISGGYIGPTYLIYHWFDTDKFNERKLLARLEESLTGNTEVHARELHDNFLKNVSLTDSVIANEDKKRILVPITYDDLRSAQDSTLLVEFIVTDKDINTDKDKKTHGSMELSKIKEYLDPPEEGSLTTSITFYDVAPLTLKGEGAWNPSVSRHISLGSEFKVKMKKYIKRGFGDLGYER